jgi:hypothetical protein
MFDDGPDRGAPSSLRGWLSDVYLPALLEGTLDALVRRLGSRASVDDPIFGRASGLPALDRYVKDMSAWLLERRGKFERLAFTTGVDRDVTEGRLDLTIESKLVTIPIAVVAERKRSREIDLRLYYSTSPLKGTAAVRSPLVPENNALPLPIPVRDHLDSLRRGSVPDVLQGFETDGELREASGVTHAKSGDLKAFYEKLLGAGGAELILGGAADDGRTCALEYTLVRLKGRTVSPQAGLAVYERGDSGLLRSVRIYEDLVT